MKLPQFLFILGLLAFDIGVLFLGSYQILRKSKLKYVDYIDDEGRVVHALERVHDD